MDIEGVEKLFSRAIRARRRLGVKGGDGANWFAESQNGDIHRYFINGVKSPEEIEDDIMGIFLWLWSLKDNVKQHCKSKGLSGEWVEKEINSDQYLCICGDIANRTKHPDLEKGSRSRTFPSLGKLKYQIPQEALSSITVGAFDVGIDVGNSKLISLEMPVLSNDGRYLGDAFKYIDYALRAWEKIIDRADKAV